MTSSSLSLPRRSAGYCSDMTRTVCLGQPKDEKLVELHALVLEAQEHAEQRVRPGMTGQEGDSLSRDIIVRAAESAAANQRELRQALAAHVGGIVTLGILRGGAPLDLSAEVGEWPGEARCR